MIGTISGVLLAICGLPLMISTIIEGRDYTPSLFFWAWYLGEIGMIIHVLLNIGYDPGLLINYGFNTVFLSVICFYRFFPRKDAKT
jgi:hypothetical protein